MIFDNAKLTIKSHTGKSQKHDNTLWRNDITITLHEKKAICKGAKKASSLHQNFKKMAKKFYDILTKSGNKCTILLYGYIGAWEDVKAKDVTREIIEAAAQYQDIEVRINSMGGEVYEAIAIFNTLRLCQSNVTIFVDGVAASAASFIATCGKPVYMGKYSELMLHEASGCCCGNKHEMDKCSKELSNIDDQLCQIFADKCGKTKDEIKAAYFDGSDHWLTAQEALDMKLIDGIYDMEEVDGTPQARYATIYNRLEQQRKPQINNNMNLEDLKNKDARFKDCKTEAEALDMIASLGTAPKGDPVKDAQIAKLQAENKAFKDAEEAKQKAEKKALLDAAEADGRITAENRKTYEAVLDKDYENGKAILESLKTKSKVEDILNHASNQGEKKLSPFEARKKEIEDRFYNRH